MASIHKVDKEGIGTVKPLYTDLNIPTKLFFDILNSRVFSMLGKGSEDELQKVFESIFDEYLDLGGNNSIKKWYEQARKLEALKLIEKQTKTIIYALLYTPMSIEERNLLIDVLNEVPKLNARVDKDKNIIDELDRVNKRCLGSLRNEINLVSIDDKKEETVKESAKYIFQQDLARISITLGFQIATNLTMYEFITYKNSAIESVKQRKQSLKG